jgi:2-polyprenyl-3-methyl-5-hydroxy-6-metoxy-1,4-benzoquinol methylase
VPDFACRSRLAELMDDPGVAAAEMRRTLDELEWINRALNGYAPSLAGIAALLPGDARELTLLDVGTGCGDLPRRVVRWAGGRGVRARVVGIDVAPAAVEHAILRSSGCEGVSFERADLFALPAAERFDIVHAAMVLHHFEDEKAPLALRRMFELARWGIVVNDIHRHPLAYHGIRLLTRCLSQSRLIRNDAPLSVLRAFRRGELERLVREAGLPAGEIHWHWAFRWRLVVRKT